MPTDFLHNHKDFGALLRIVAEEMKVAPVLVEKDYWIMHCLYGLQQLEMQFELKGGTSLSKGYRIINRFSEDIDIRIEPPEAMGVKTGNNHDKPAHREGRKAFYDWLAETITIDGIKSIERDIEFDNESYRSGGIRLYYPETTGTASVLKDGVLLEVGFDTVAPNIDKDISSWAYDYASSRVELIDNRALAVPCYNPATRWWRSSRPSPRNIASSRKPDSSPLISCGTITTSSAYWTSRKCKTSSVRKPISRTRTDGSRRLTIRTSAAIPLSAFPIPGRSGFTSAHMSGRRRSIIMAGRA